MRNKTEFGPRSCDTSWRCLVWACAIGTLLFALAQTTQAQPVADQTVAQQNHTDKGSTSTGEHYRIGPGDVLEVRVYKLDQLSRAAVRVEDNGMIRMPLIGEVQAACRTETELAKEIGDGYFKYMRNPQVDVFIKEFNSRPVAVIGAVNTPGRFQLQRRVRLLELMTFAGGPAERAGGNIQIVHSDSAPTCGPNSSSTTDDQALEVSVYKLNDTLRGDAQANPYVLPGDVVTILESEQVYVVGNVVKPSAIPLKERVTVSQAIAMSGGTLPDTKSERVRIVRQEKGRTTKTEIIVDLKAISRHSAEDIALQANDIVEVPTASGKRFLRALLTSVVPSAARLPIQIIR